MSRVPGPEVDGTAGRQRATQRLGKAQRLVQTSLFQETYAQGRRWIGRFMVLWLREGEGAALRLGVVSGRKVGPAVERNKARRRLREAYRRNRSLLVGPFDVILVARKGASGAPWDALVTELLSLARQAGLMKEAWPPFDEQRTISN